MSAESDESAQFVNEGDPVSNPLRELGAAGQSVWLDFIRRSLLSSGELQRLIDEDGVTGLTSNPTIFEKAIASGTDYDAQLRALLEADPDLPTAQVFEALALDDIRAAADAFRPVFDRTGGADGFVSHEVRADLAGNTQATISEARRLWAAIARPNLMIKVPATPAGIPAIEQLIADGINVNVTLMFSLDHYEQVAQAYIRGVERCANPSRASSVASFFVSRVDTLVDRALDRIGSAAALALRGRIAVANSKVVYQRFREIFSVPSFAALRARGARPQRPLWASTSTKNPAYRDVLYVEDLVGPDTVNTMPPETIAAFRDHGRVRPTVEDDPAAARRVLLELEGVGVHLDAITEQLQVDGVAAFAKSYETLLAALAAKRSALRPNRLDAQVLALGPSSSAVAARVTGWQQGRLSQRIWAKDHTVWSAQPVPELTDRLGWLSLPESMVAQLGTLAAFAEQVRAEGVRHAVLLGMGGSSLAPEVFQATFGHRAGHPELLVLDSTHPDAVRAIDRRIDPDRTIFLVSSKSGGTSETLSFFRYFWHRYPASRAGGHFVAITDPGTSLERLAEERGFRRVFHAPPDVGGRYSALTVFGLVPAALIGVDLEALLRRARVMERASGPDVEGDANPSTVLGAALGELALRGRDKLTFLVAPPFGALPAWAEQLVAESTGKNGKGIVPVADEPVWPAESYASDRVFVSVALAGADDASLEPRRQALAAQGHPVIRVALGSPLDLGQEFYRWELATAAAGAALGVQPFDQPDVQLAKDLARQAMAGDAHAAGSASASLTDPAAWPAAIASWLSKARSGDYIGLQAYLAPSAEIAGQLARLRDRLGRRAGLATTLGFGPRFLHSTGQLHKGGPATGLFLQVTDEVRADLPVPETSYRFGQLIAAQAEGDALALERRGRRVLRIGLGAEPARALEGLLDRV